MHTKNKLWVSDMALFSDLTWNQWIAQYAQSHQHPANRLCHKIGIPMIVLSLLMLPALWFWPGLWAVPLVLFVVGWVFQFVGHVFEGKPPEFFSDWRFLFVGVRWWFKH